jgi:hypothetical protein
MEKRPDNLLKAALIANDCLQMHDLTFFLLRRYDELCGSRFAEAYAQYFDEPTK